MGYIVHNCLIVTSCGEKEFSDAVAKATELGLVPSIQSTEAPQINGYKSFAIFSCGSKSGWIDSNQHIAALEKLVEYLESFHMDFEYVWVDYGHDPGKVVVKETNSRSEPE